MWYVLVPALVLGCATETHTGRCSCEIVQGPDRCTIEHEEKSYDQRPFMEKLLNGIAGILGFGG